MELKAYNSIAAIFARLMLRITMVMLKGVCCRFFYGWYAIFLCFGSCSGFFFCILLVYLMKFIFHFAYQKNSMATILDILDTNRPLSQPVFSLYVAHDSLLSAPLNLLYILLHKNHRHCLQSFSPLINIVVTTVEPPLESTTLSKILSSVTLYALFITHFGFVQKSG